MYRREDIELCGGVDTVRQSAAVPTRGDYPQTLSAAWEHLPVPDAFKLAAHALRLCDATPLPQLTREEWKTLGLGGR